MNNRHIHSIAWNQQVFFSFTLVSTVAFIAAVWMILRVIHTHISPNDDDSSNANARDSLLKDLLTPRKIERAMRTRITNIL